jgi:anaerobic selenocysteine-containing dehydrogenase
MIVVDPVRTETADLADIHLQVKPGTDAWCLAGLLGVLVQEDLLDHAFLTARTTGGETVIEHLEAVDVARCARTCGVDEDLLRRAARVIGAASSVSTYEDLGVQQGPNSTLVSYLNKLTWLLTGNFATPGAMQPHSWIAPGPATPPARAAPPSPELGCQAAWCPAMSSPRRSSPITPTGSAR